MTTIPESEYQKLQARLNEASRMVTVVRDSNDAITIQDFEGKITAWNRGAELMYGYSEQEALKKNIWDLTPPDKATEQKGFNRRLLAGEAVTSLETQRLTKDGRLLDVWMTVTKLVDEAGKVIGIASTERDITGRKKAEAVLKESEERFRILYESSQDAIMTLTPPSWNFTAGNPATIKLFRCKDEAEFTATAPWHLSPEFQPDGRPSSDKAKEMIETAMRQGTNFFEWTHRRMNGEDFPATVLLTRVAMGGESFLQATVRDISEDKRKEKEIASKMTELEQYYKVTMGREDRILKLKQEVKELKTRLGEE